MNEDPKIEDPVFSPPALMVMGIGILCFILGIILGWSNHGTRDSEIPPSQERKSMVLRMPSNRNYNGAVTLKMRNGDNHEFDTTSEVLQILIPGMIGTATIHGRKLLNFEPERDQPNLKSKQAPQSVEDSGPNQP